MELQITADNSTTLFCNKTNQTYHSMDGAILEARHVYINPAFAHFIHKKELHILEIGFGTGLNALISYLKAQKENITLIYETIEAYPVPATIYKKLNYPEMLGCDKIAYLKLHQTPSGTKLVINNFTFLKKHIKLEEYNSNRIFDIIYFDAFSPDSQPELWTTDIFTKMNNYLRPNGILLTYSAKGIVKKALRNAGFEIKRLPGAGKKHHMIKAIKQENKCPPFHFNR